MTRELFKENLPWWHVEMDLAHQRKRRILGYVLVQAKTPDIALFVAKMSAPGMKRDAPSKRERPAYEWEIGMVVAFIKKHVTSSTY